MFDTMAVKSMVGQTAVEVCVRAVRSSVTAWGDALTTAKGGSSLDIDSAMGSSNITKVDVNFTHEVRLKKTNRRRKANVDTKVVSVARVRVCDLMVFTSYSGRALSHLVNLGNASVGVFEPPLQHEELLKQWIDQLSSLQTSMYCTDGNKQRMYERHTYLKGTLHNENPVNTILYEREA